MKNLFLILSILLVTSYNFIKEEKRVLQVKEGDSTLVVNIPKASCKKCQKILKEGVLKEYEVQ